MPEPDPAGDRLERLRIVTEAAMRALAGRTDLALPPANRRSDAGNLHGRMPVFAGPPTGEALARLRGDADAIALRLRWHDPALHARLAPSGGTARAVFDALEQVRVEALGARRMAGVAANLRAAAQARCRARGFADARTREDVPVADILALLARERLTGARCWPPSGERIVGLWRAWLGAGVERHLAELPGDLANQAGYAERVHLVLEVARLYDAADAALEPAAGTPEPEHVRPDDVPGTEDAIDAASRDHDAASSRALEASAPLAGRAEETGTDPATQGPARTAPRAQSPRAGAPRSRYRPYSTAHDEIVAPHDLRDRGELLRLRASLDEHIAAHGRTTCRDALRLQRELLASKPGSWDIELEEGLLDTARLGRAIAAPDGARVYRRERAQQVPDTIVTILIDNSGSMRGRPIALAATATDILARTLERCGIGVEILGFTTCAWKGGLSRRDWLAHGRPPAPGRLTDLRHVVYKSASTPWRRARLGLALMLDEGLLKENVDGEALLWAHERLLARPEKRRVLMVVSDGEPLDDSTACANTPDYLGQHLREVIAWIERVSLVELTAIGIYHDVSQYYRRALTLDDPEQLGSAMIRELSCFLETFRGSPPGLAPPTRHRPR